MGLIRKIHVTGRILVYWDMIYWRRQDRTSFSSAEQVNPYYILNGHHIKITAMKGKEIYISLKYIITSFFLISFKYSINIYNLLQTDLICIYINRVKNIYLWEIYQVTIHKIIRRTFYKRHLGITMDKIYDYFTCVSRYIVTYWMNYSRVHFPIPEQLKLHISE